MKLISIVIPLRNEALNLNQLCKRLTAVAESELSYQFEFIVVDNCSEDASASIVLEMRSKDSRWKLVQLSRNFGIDASMSAGIEFSRGEAIILLFSDLQDPPEEIPRILKVWTSSNAEVVYGTLKRRKDHHWMKSLGARIAHWCIYQLSDVKIPPNTTDFRLITRRVADCLALCGERNRYLRGLVHWIGFKQVAFVYDREPRTQGKTNFGIFSSIDYAISALVAFSTKPLRLASSLGLLSMLSSVLGAMVYTLIRILAYWNVTPFTVPPPGWATIVLLILFFGGLQCLFFGIIGEYLGGLIVESKRRPLWVVNQTWGLKEAGRMQSTPQVMSQSEIFV